MGVSFEITSCDDEGLRRVYCPAPSPTPKLLRRPRHKPRRLVAATAQPILPCIHPAALRDWLPPAGFVPIVLLLSIIAICLVVTMEITAAVLVFATRVSAGVRRSWGMCYATALR